LPAHPKRRETVRGRKIAHLKNVLFFIGEILSKKAL